MTVQLLQKPISKGTLLFLLAFLSRCIYIIYQPLIDTDYQLIHVAADNLLNGNGLAYPRTYLSDLSAIYYDPMRYWPPLTAFLVALVKGITHSKEATDLILMFSGMFCLLLLIKKVMHELQCNQHTQTIIWIMLMTNPEPFRSIGLSDLFGCISCLWSVYICLKVLSNKAKKHWSLWSPLIFILPAAFRYQYYPVIFVFPFFLITAGWLLHNKNLTKKSLQSFLLLAAYMLIYVMVLKLYTKGLFYAVTDSKGLYPGNLLFLYPFLIKSFINSGYFENRIAEHLQWFKLSYLALHICLFVSLFIFLLRYFKNQLLQLRKNRNHQSGSDHLLQNLLFFFVSCAVLFTLIGTSLIYNSRSGVFGGWTYAGEARYFMVPVLLILLGFLRYYQDQLFKHRLLKVILIFTIIWNSLLWLKFGFNIATNNLPDKEIQSKTDRRIIEQKILDLQKNNLPVIISYKDPFLAFYSMPTQYAVTQKIPFLLDSGYKTTAPVQFLILTKKELSERETDFLKRNGAQLIYNGGMSNLYYLLAEKNSKSQ